MTNSDPEYTDEPTELSSTPDPADVEQPTHAGLPGPDDEIQVTGHVLGPGDGVEYEGPDQEQVPVTNDEI